LRRNSRYYRRRLDLKAKESHPAMDKPEAEFREKRLARRLVMTNPKKMVVKKGNLKRQMTSKAMQRTAKTFSLANRPQKTARKALKSQAR